MAVGVTERTYRTRVGHVTQPQWGSPPNSARSGWGPGPARAPWGTPSGPPWGVPSRQPWGAPPAQSWGGAPQQGGPNQWPVRRPPRTPQFQPPRRRRSPFGTLIKLVLLVMAIMFVSSILRGFLSGGPVAPTQPGQSDVPANGSYANEEYQAPPADMNPPELPAPETVGEAETLLTRNPVYSQSIPAPTNCRMGTLDANTATTAQLQTHLNDLMACLMAVWEAPVEAAGFQLPRPPLTVYDSPVRTACGVMQEVNAAYCAGDQRIYYARPLLRAFPQAVRTTDYAAETIVAHEFGHAVQARTAILISDKALEQRASKNEALEMSRRTETQADCFSAMYVRSVAQSQNLDASRLRDLEQLAYNIGDDVLSGDSTINEGHGLGRSRQAWFSRGLGSDRIDACNTWTAPSSSVR